MNKTPVRKAIDKILDRDLKDVNKLHQSLVDSVKKDDNKRKKILESIHKIMTGDSPLEQFSIQEIHAEVFKRELDALEK